MPAQTSSNMPHCDRVRERVSSTFETSRSRSSWVQGLKVRHLRNDLALNFTRLAKLAMLVSESLLADDTYQTFADTCAKMKPNFCVEYIPIRPLPSTTCVFNIDVEERSRNFAG